MDMNPEQSGQQISAAPKTIDWKIILGLGVLLIVGVGIAWSRMSPKVPQEHSKSEIITTAGAGTEDSGVTTSVLKIAQEILPAYPPNLVLAYALLESNADARARRWPTYSIWIKKGTATPEQLAVVGKEGEYPSRFVLSPDHRYIAIDLEKKLQLLNIGTKELRTVFTTENGTAGIAFSLDGSELWVAEGSSLINAQNEGFAIYSIDVTTGENTLEARDDGKDIHGDFLLTHVRSDGTVFYDALTYTEGRGDSGSFDLKTQKVGDNHAGSLLSEDGKVGLGDAVESVPDHCSEYGGSVSMVVKAVEPTTGVTLGTIGRHNERMSPIAFSPDDKKVLYKTSANLDCEDSNWSYFLQDIQPNSVPTLVRDPNVVLAEWNRPQFIPSNDPTDTVARAVHNIVMGLRFSETAQPIVRVSGAVPNGSGTLVQPIGGYYLQ